MEGLRRLLFDYTALDDPDLEDMLKDQTRKVFELECDIAAAMNAMACLREELVRRVIREKCIWKGDIVMIRWTDEPKRYCYEGITNKGKAQLRGFTKKGKPRKDTIVVGHCTARHMTKTD